MRDGSTLANSRPSQPGSKEKLKPNSDLLTWNPLMDGLSKKSKTHLYGIYREPSSVLANAKLSPLFIV